MTTTTITATAINTTTMPQLLLQKKL